MTKLGPTTGLPSSEQVKKRYILKDKQHLGEVQGTGGTRRQVDFQHRDWNTTDKTLRSKTTKRTKPWRKPAKAQ